MLIECPNCKMMISEKMVLCPNCQFQMSQEKVLNNLDKEALVILYEKGNLEFIKKLGEIHNFKTIQEVKQYINQSPYLKKEYDLVVAGNKKVEEVSNIPKCPTCGSTDLKRAGIFDYIYTTTYGTNTISFICKNCGYKW